MNEENLENKTEEMTTGQEIIITIDTNQITPKWLSDNAQEYNARDFTIGERVRIYLNYSQILGTVEFKEGIVTASDSKKSPLFAKLRLKVERAGIIENGEIDLKEKVYERNYLYERIGLVEKLRDGRWEVYMTRAAR